MALSGELSGAISSGAGVSTGATEPGHLVIRDGYKQSTVTVLVVEATTL